MEAREDEPIIVFTVVEKSEAAKISSHSKFTLTFCVAGFFGYRYTLPSGDRILSEYASVYDIPEDVVREVFYNHTRRA